MKCALCFSVKMLISIILNYIVSIFDLLIRGQRCMLGHIGCSGVVTSFNHFYLICNMTKLFCLLDLSTWVKGVGKSGIFTCILFYISFLSI